MLDDGRIELNSNSVERSIRLLVLNRKNALFAGSDGGSEHWAVLASLIETCRLSGMELGVYFADGFQCLVSGYPISRPNKLLAWSWPKTVRVKGRGDSAYSPLNRNRL